MTDADFAAELTLLEAQGEAGKQAMWRHIKEHGGMKRVAALVQAGAGKTKAKKPRATANLPALMDGPALISIPLVDSTDFGVTAALVRDWEAAYPAVDVPQQLRAMRAWCVANRPQRKTRTGIMRFMNSWLAKEQNRGGGRQNGRSSAHDNMLAGAAMFLSGENGAE